MVHIVWGPSCLAAQQTSKKHCNSNERPIMYGSYKNQTFKCFFSKNHNFSCHVIIGLKFKIGKLEIQRSEVIIQV